MSSSDVRPKIGKQLNSINIFTMSIMTKVPLRNISGSSLMSSLPQSEYVAVIMTTLKIGTNLKYLIQIHVI